MTTLNFTLSAEAVNQVSEALVCLAKFGESVSLEARQDRLTLTALNLSKTAYAAFTLDAKAFFTEYTFRQFSSTRGDRFTGQLYNKALQCAFKGRDPRARENTVTQCDVTLQDQPDKVECRLIVKVHHKHGMTKVHRLVYEPVQIMHALFDSTSAVYGWSIRSRIMREYIEYFGPRTEQLDMQAQEGKAIFTSFTEKITDGREVLKQPLETIITLHKEDFDDFHMPEDMHVVISVRDFKAIVTHAESFHGVMKSAYSSPTRPLQITYGGEGIACEFTLMTTGDKQEGTVLVSTRSQTVQSMPPPIRPAQPLSHTSKPPMSQANKLSYTSTQTIEQAEPDSLFMPLEDEAWDPPNYDQEEQLGYDASYNEQPAPRPTLQDSTSSMSRQISLLSRPEGLESTQRLSQLHGMFD